MNRLKLLIIGPLLLSVAWGCNEADIPEQNELGGALQKAYADGSCEYECAWDASFCQNNLGGVVTGGTCANSQVCCQTSAPALPQCSGTCVKEWEGCAIGSMPNSENCSDMLGVCCVPDTSTDPYAGVNVSMSVINTWDTGYCVDIEVEKLTPWTVEFDLAGATVYDLWNGTYTVSGDTLRVDGSLSDFGFCANTAFNGSLAAVTNVYAADGTLISGTPVLIERELTQCFRIKTEFTDETGLEDWRTTDKFFRRARGAKITVTDAEKIDEEYYLDEETGCVSLPIVAASEYEITLHAKARIKGIDISSFTWNCHSDGTDPCGDKEQYEIDSKNFVYQIGSVPSVQYEEIALVDNNSGNNNRRNQSWHNLAVGMWAVHRDTYNLLDNGNTDDCGGPGVPCCGHNEWNAVSKDGRNWHHDFLDPNHIVFFVQNGIYQSDNLASYWVNSTVAGIDNPAHNIIDPSTGVKYNAYIPAVGTQTGMRKKFQIAHELGHSIVMKRMGQRTSEDFSAPLDGCMGSYKTTKGAPDMSKPCDVGGGAGEKSELTMEYSSGAAREGWAHFFAAWLFNDASQSDCFLPTSFSYQDFDLDGNVDNFFGANSPLNTVINCEGMLLNLETPVKAENTFDAWVTAHDWIKDANNAGECATSGFMGRSTQYDWMRYFWDMASDEAVPMSTMTDIYVDMCPTDWESAPSTALATPDWPEVRLDRSAAFHDCEAQHDRQAYNGVDHYQIVIVE